MRISLRTGGLRGSHSISVFRRSKAAAGSTKARLLRRIANVIVCAAIVGVASVTLGFKAHDDVKMTATLLRPEALRNSTDSYGGWQCIYRSIRAGVPRGSAVYVNYRNALYFQRLAELTTTWATPRPSLSAAQWRLFIFKAPEHCSGLELAVVRS